MTRTDKSSTGSYARKGRMRDERIIREAPGSCRLCRLVGPVDLELPAGLNPRIERRTQRKENHGRESCSGAATDPAAPAGFTPAGPRFTRKPGPHLEHALSLE